MLNLIKIGSSVKDIIDPRRLYISNYFKTFFKKKVLIVYLTTPFIDDNNFRHSNNAEVIEIAKIFNELSYTVDILNYNINFNKVKFSNSEYDIIFGLEPNFLKAVTKFKPKKSIYYATGSHYVFQNKAEKERILDLEKRRGIRLPLVRYVEPHESSSIADAVICIGNNHTKETYKDYCKNIEMVRISAYSFFPLFRIGEFKNFEKAKRNFLWFGSAGAVHKGLDIVLDIFKGRHDLQLYVCGGVATEKDFFSLYEKELTNCDNIHFIGWIRPDTEEFKRLMLTCAFTILPSCSEGMSGSIATCMHSGLIPLVSRECGLDVNESGIVFPDNKIATVAGFIDACSSKESDWVELYSRKANEFAVENNNINVFKKDFKRALMNIL